MGISKSEHFTEEQNELADVAWALGHPARIAILQCLMQIDGCICGDLVEQLPLSQATISQHLKELKAVGLIKGTVEGKSVCYCISEGRLDQLTNFFNQLKQHVSERKPTCC